MTESKRGGSAPWSRDWHVLVIGGPSGVGKTTLSAQLRRVYDVNCVEIDDLFAAAKVLRGAGPRTSPEIEMAPLRSTDELVDSMIATSTELAPAVREIIWTHLDDGPPAIVEGDFLLPSDLATWVRESDGRLLSLFLYEDEAQIVLNFASRFGVPPAAQLERAQVSARFGAWLGSEAQLAGLHVLSSSPWSTLLDRVRELNPARA